MREGELKMWYLRGQHSERGGRMEENGAKGRALMTPTSKAKKDGPAMTCPCRSIHCSKCPGGRGLWGISVPSSQCC